MSPRPYNRSQINDGGDEGERPSWMITYADMMTLLLCFFVLLYSFSAIDVMKFEAFLTSFRGAIGVLEGGKTIIDDTAITAGHQAERLGPSIMSEGEFEDLFQDLRTYIIEEGLEKNVDLIRDERGLTISFSGRVLFELGRAELKPEAFDILSETAEFLKTISNMIRIEGHTDNLPISTDRFPSNWELSTARATNVIRHLIEEQNLDPRRLSAAGYSKYRPVADNETAEGRSKNRRVDIVILRRQQEIMEPQGGDRDG